MTKKDRIRPEVKPISVKPNIHYSVASLDRTQGKRKAGARFPKNPRELDRENALEETLHSKLLRLVEDDKTTTRRCKSDKEGQDWAGSILTKLGFHMRYHLFLH